MSAHIRGIKIGGRGLSKEFYKGRSDIPVPYRSLNRYISVLQETVYLFFSYFLMEYVLVNILSFKLVQHSFSFFKLNEDMSHRLFSVAIIGRELIGSSICMKG